MTNREEMLHRQKDVLAVIQLVKLMADNTPRKGDIPCAFDQMNPNEIRRMIRSAFCLMEEDPDAGAIYVFRSPLVRGLYRINPIFKAGVDAYDLTHRAEEWGYIYITDEWGILRSLIDRAVLEELYRLAAEEAAATSGEVRQSSFILGGGVLVLLAAGLLRRREIKG